MASPELTDPRSERVRRLRRLARRAYRAETGRFLVEGAHAAGEAILGAARGTVTVRELLVTADAAARHSALLEEAGRQELTVTSVNEAVAASLSETVTPQGIVAVCDALDVSIADVAASDPRLVVVLADVRDPGNAGAVIRAADAAGADGVVLAGDSVDPYNGKAVRASVGSIFHVPIVHGVSVDAAMTTLRACGLAILVADGSGRDDLDSFSAAGGLSHPTAWVFGNEAWGVPQTLVQHGDSVVRIPIYGRAESLNLATAATLCLYASRWALNAADSGQPGEERP